MPEITRTEWIAKRETLADKFQQMGADPGAALAQAHEALTDTLGGIPPEPAPEWRSSGFFGHGGGATRLLVRATADGIEIKHEHGGIGVRLPADEADAMARALDRCAEWLRTLALTTEEAQQNAK